MEGPPKRQVNAEDMLAELQRVLESSARLPDAPPVFASPADKSSFPDRESRPAFLRSTRPGWRSWKLTAGGLALACVAAICAGFVFMNQVAAPKRELSAAPAEALVKAQKELAREPSGGARAPIQGSRTPGLLQAGALEAQPAAGAAPANNAPLPAREAADVDSPNLASFGLESPPPVFAPSTPDQAPALAPAERIGPDGAPIAAAPAPASTGSAPQAETPNKTAMPATSLTAKPEAAKVAVAPAPASTRSAPQAETTNKTASSAASPMAKPEVAKVAAAPAPASTSSAPQAETPKPKAAPTEHASNESERPSTPKFHSRKQQPERRSLQRPARSAKASGKPAAGAERRSTEPSARPKEAEQAPGPAQGAGAPAAVAPVAAPTAPQRFADGVTHAFGYLIHLPGALVSHSPDPNAGAH